MLSSSARVRPVPRNLRNLRNRRLVDFNDPIVIDTDEAQPSPPPPPSYTVDFDRVLPFEGKSAESTHRYQCCICHNLLCEPVCLTGCTHAVCNACFQQLRTESSHALRCPQCRAPTDPPAVSGFIRSELWDIRVRCANEGCSDVFALGVDYRNDREHALSCGFVRVSCRHCKASDILRADIVAHETACPRQPVQCDSCAEMVPLEEIEAHRNGIGVYCAGWVACPNQCRNTDLSACHDGKRRKADTETETPDAVNLVRRAYLESHMTECPRQVVACAICDQQYQRRYENDHARTSKTKHIACLLQRLQRLEGKTLTSPEWRRCNEQVLALNPNQLPGGSFNLDGLRSEGIHGSAWVLSDAVHELHMTLWFKPSLLEAQYMLRVRPLQAAAVGDMASDCSDGFNKTRIRGDIPSFSTQFSVGGNVSHQRVTNKVMNLRQLAEGEGALHANQHGEYGLLVELYFRQH
jgi:hypothetical protein